MKYVAKLSSSVEQDAEYYELFRETTALDMLGGEVQVAESLGVVSIAQLENEKEYHESMLAEVSSKIETINEEAAK